MYGRSEENTQPSTGEQGVNLTSWKATSSDGQNLTHSSMKVVR